MSLWSAILEDLAVLGERRTVVACIVRMWTDPSFAALLRWRVSCSLQARGGIGLLPAKLLWKRNVRMTSCFLSPRAQLGRGIVLPHATGIVVGEGVRLGDGVTIYQGVTLGRRDAVNDGYPTIGDSVTVFAGACVLGGCSVGAGAVVAANAVVISSVERGATVGGVPAKVLRRVGARMSACS